MESMQRKGMSMSEVENLMMTLVEKLHATKEYNQYRDLLQRVKGQPELYGRIGEFRRRGISLRMAENINAIQANNDLQKEFRDLLSNGLANDFLVAERQYCRMVKELQEKFLEGARIETEFLDG